MKQLRWILLLIILIYATGFAATANPEKIMFVQEKDGLKTVFVCNSNGSDYKQLIQAKFVVIDPQGQSILIANDRQLELYNIATGERKVLREFVYNIIQTFTYQDNKALVVVSKQLLSLYMKDNFTVSFTDGKMQEIPENQVLSYSSLYGSLGKLRPTALKCNSPDGKSLLEIKYNQPAYTLTLKTKNKPTWRLPKNITILPEAPIWSPNSKFIVFYAGELLQGEGYYSLYLVNIDDLEPIIIQPNVQIQLIPRMRDLIPNWSSDSNEIAYQYQPFGLPNQSSILIYNVITRKTRTLTQSSSSNQYPCWSPSGKQIMFVSNRNNTDFSLYVIDSYGLNLTQISPPQANIIQAVWCR